MDLIEAGPHFPSWDPPEDGKVSRKLKSFVFLVSQVSQKEKHTGQAFPEKELPGDWEKAASSLNTAPAPRSIHLLSKQNKKGHLKAKLLLALAEAKH